VKGMVLVIFTEARYDRMVGKVGTDYYLGLHVDIVGYVPKSYEGFVSRMFSVVKDIDWGCIECVYLSRMLKELSSDKKFLAQENDVAFFVDKGHVFTIEKVNYERFPKLHHYIVFGRGLHTPYSFDIFVDFLPDIESYTKMYLDNKWITENIEKASKLTKDNMIHYGFAPFFLLEDTTLSTLKTLLEKYVTVEFP
jgi:hypothetical protein